MARRAFTEHELVASICKASLYEFTKEFWGEISAETPVWNWHVEYLCGELQKMCERIFAGLPREYDFVCNCPPGSTKSSVFSVMLPAWAWTRMPSFKFIGASYAYSLAMELSRKTRDVVRSEKYQKCFPNVKLREDQDSKGFFVNTANGSRFAVGVNGSVLGMHAHAVVIDDALDPEQSFSDAEVKIANRWMTHTLPQRKVDKAVAPMILVMQRLRADDPSGEMIENSKRPGAFPVRHVRLPAEDSFEISPPELRDRYKDGLMDPVRLPRAVLQAERARNEYSYVSQYGQDPRPVGSRMFEEHYFTQREKAAPFNSQRIRYWDRACLIAGTRVRTWRGDVPIESVMVGDKVLTRDGYKAVKKAWCTMLVSRLVSVRFSNGSVVTGTEDHPVFTNNRGWVPLAQLVSSDYVPSIAPGEQQWLESGGRILSPSSSTGSSTTEAPASDTTKPGDGTSSARNTTRTPCTERSGDTIGVTSPTAMTFITWTGTGTTTPSTISNACRALTTIESTIRSPDGTPGQKPRSRGSETEKSAGLIGPGTTGLASSVALISERDTSHLSESNTALRSAKIGLARSGYVPVYDLEVEDSHEFFADGILVHNSSDGLNNPNACFTAGVLMAKAGDGKYYVEHVHHGQWEPSRRNKEMRMIAQRDRDKYGPYEPVIWVEREGGSAGRDAWMGVASALAGFVVREDAVSGKKEVRAEPFACQCAAGNVVLIQDGTWDVRGYVEELLAFPHAKLKDRTDASSGSFNLLANVKKLQAMRILKTDPRPRAGVTFLVAEEQDLGAYKEESHALVVSVADPLSGCPSLPDGSVPNLVDARTVEVVDVDRASYQDRWEDPVEPYGKLPAELLLTEDAAKRLWAFLLKNRPQNAAVVLFVERGGTRRALSLAQGVADGLRLPGGTVQKLSGGDTIPSEVNGHVRDVIRRSRHAVG